MVAANPLRGEASFEAEGQSYTLAYDINALVLAEEASGLDMDQLLDRLDRGLNLRVLRAVVWAGLQRDHECHLLRAGEIIGAAGIPVVAVAMRKGLMAAFPAAEKAPPENPRKAAGGTGSAG
jgi:hypothetical protein